MSLSRFARVSLASCALGLPFVLVATTVSGFVDPLSRVVVEALLHASAPLQAPVAAIVPAEPPATAEAPALTGAVLAAPGKGPERRAAPRPAQAPSSLFISAEKVLHLSRSAARPQGTFVAATPTHPAGLRLSGVAGLGIGVQEGDILVEALGVTPRSAGQIIGAIIEARAKQARYLSGSIWRRGQTLRITVEQPYLSPSP